MKASKTATEALSDMGQIRTNGDLRRLISNAMLALLRKEISATDTLVLAKCLDAVSNNLNSEVTAAKTQLVVREKGGDFGKIVAVGSLLIDGSDRE